MAENFKSLAEVLPQLAIRRAIQQVFREFEPRFREARSQGDEEQFERLVNDYSFAISRYTDQLEAIKTGELMEQAVRYGVTIDDLPPPKLEHSYWRTGRHGTAYLTAEGLAAYRKAVRRAKTVQFREFRDAWLPWIGAMTGLVGALTGLLAVRS